MDFQEYQKKSRETAIYPSVGKSFVYPTMGLTGEAGEVSEKIKKLFRDKNGEADEETKKELQKELGDVLWYLSQIATEFDLSLNEIAEKNIEKLFSRKKRGTLHGNGDNR
ncbi:nucleoside triphosphate pyrophosphohydrolase family protein [Candidatus Falkowbacteria bacterium]|nr:nucleoside triphosphate pyrophosphohydrolase family protein [Candidatus Falkowbacteria bacterium]